MGWFGKSKKVKGPVVPPVAKAHGNAIVAEPVKPFGERVRESGLELITTPFVDEKTQTCQIGGVTYDAIALRQGGSTRAQAEDRVISAAKKDGYSMLSVLGYEQGKKFVKEVFIAGAYKIRAE